MPAKHPHQALPLDSALLGMSPRTCYEAGSLVGSTLYTVITPVVPVIAAINTAINALGGSTGGQADGKNEEHRDTNHQV